MVKQMKAIEIIARCDRDLLFSTSRVKLELAAGTPAIAES